MLTNVIKGTLTLVLMGLLAGCPQEDVEQLSAESMNGRAPQTQGSQRAQTWLINKLQALGAQPLNNGSYKQQYSSGTNILGMLRGSSRADEYIIIGAHYDHLGNNCSAAENDNICNGAADNAAGVAVVLEIAEAMLREQRERKRSIILAFWDGEEDGLIGSQAYTNNPLAPLSKTVTYLNFDIMGANLLPTLRWSTFVIGAETGGQTLERHVLSAVLNPNNPIEPRLLTNPFSQHRSDHASFLTKRIPSVFFTDAPTACYHTAQDDSSKLDFTKLQSQINLAKDLTISLVNTADRPSFTSADQISFYDSVHLFNLANDYAADLSMFNSGQRNAMLGYRNQITNVYQQGPNAYNSASFDVLGNAARGILTQIAQLPCQSFITQ